MPYIGTSPSQGVRRVHTYTATANQTSFSGAGAEGATLSYKDSNFVDVYQNGVKLGDADYTATSGTAIVLGTGATVSDLVVVVAYDVFSAADTVSKADGGQFDGNVTMAGTLGVTGVLTGTSLDISGDIDVDGTANLDVVDIDGAVDMASTLQVDGAITSSAGMTITTADNTDQLTLISTDADASNGPNLNMFRNSSSPADNDFLGNIKFNGRNDNSQDVQYAEVEVYSTDVSDGTEDGLFNVNVMTGGSNISYMQLKSGSGTVFNEDSNDIDFRVEGNSEANLLLVDAGEDNVKIGDNAGNYAKLSLRNEAAGAQERGLYVEVAPASGTSPNNVAVFSAANANLTTPVVRIHHESPTADQLLLQATTTGSNTVKFSVDEDGDIYSTGGIYLGGSGSANYLSDYEEGTYTIAETNGRSSITNNRVYYTKIGRLVTVQASIAVSSNSDVNVMQLSLPFTSSINGYYLGGGNIGYTNVSATIATKNLRPNVENAAANVFFLYDANTGLTNANASNCRIDFVISYYT